MEDRFVFFSSEQEQTLEEEQEQTSEEDTSLYLHWLGRVKVIFEWEQSKV